MDQMRSDSRKDQPERSDSATAKITVADDMQGTTQSHSRQGEDKDTGRK